MRVLFIRKIEIEYVRQVNDSSKQTTKQTNNQLRMDAATRRQNKAFCHAQFGFPRYWNESIVKCSDGSIYKGHLTRDGERTGFGKWTCPIPLTIEESKKFRTKTMEYMGLWKHDKPNGPGTYYMIYDDGKSVETVTEFEGTWINGMPLCRGSK
jgi:hypothetical protein